MVGECCPANERQHFIEHLEWASRVVASWPEWKRCAASLWNSPTKSTARRPV